MSRSYKKHPFVTDHRCGTTKHNKQIANRTIRRHKMVLMQGGEYKKAYCTYNISDYRWYWTEKDAMEHYFKQSPDSFIRKHYPTLDSYLEYQKKCCVRK